MPATLIEPSATLLSIERLALEAAQLLDRADDTPRHLARFVPLEIGGPDRKTLAAWLPKAEHDLCEIEGLAQDLASVAGELRAAIRAVKVGAAER